MEMSFRRSENNRAGLIAGRVRLCGTLVLVGSVFVGFLLFVSLILPALESKGYVKTLCNVTEFSLQTDQYHRLKCNCPPNDDSSRCVIFYPCLQLLASYEIDTPQQALVVKCRRHVGDKCSYIIRDYECASERSVYKELKNYRDRFGRVGLTFPCYIKANQPGYAVLMSNHLKTKHVVNVILWPCLGAMMGLIMMMSSKILSSYYCGYQYHRASDDTEPLTSPMES